jgi:GDP-L-fucose synthase
LVFNETMPDGVHQKLLDISRLSALGWKARTQLREGLGLTYDAYRIGTAIGH